MMNPTRIRHQKAMDDYLQNADWWRTQDQQKTPAQVKHLIDSFLDWQENEITDLQRAIDRQKDES